MKTGNIEIADGEARAVISPHGAELLSWQVGGRELMWTPDAAIWDRVSPILFPVVGWCRDGQLRAADQTYPMGVHGFAAQCEFEIERRSPASAMFVLRDNEKTRTYYPFAFEFSVTFEISGAALGVELVVRNTGHDKLPYACGVHPGFSWPFAGGQREQYVIRFGAEEIAHVPVIAKGGLFSSDSRGVALLNQELALSDKTFAEEALCFLNARSTSLDFMAPSGAKISASFENFPHLALWSKPGAPFVCLEGWTGHGDPTGFEGDITTKPSMTLLAPAESGFHRAVFSFSMRL